MIPMIVLGLSLDETTNSPVLILQQKDIEEKYEEKRILPVWIGINEAVAISLALNRIQTDRPLPLDLLYNSLIASGCRLTGVSFMDLRGGVFYVTLDILKDDKLIQVDCRPSDAVVLAARAGADILVSEAVFRKSFRARTDPATPENERYPSDNGEDLVRDAAQQALTESPGLLQSVRFFSFQENRQAPEWLDGIGKAMNPGATGDVGIADQEQQLTELLRSLNPPTGRTM